MKTKMIEQIDQKLYPHIRTFGGQTSTGSFGK